MYIARINIEQDAEGLLEFLSGNSFGQLISVSSEGIPNVTHLPFLIKKTDNGLLLEGHIAIANPQSKDLLIDKNVLVIFSGPHAYVSASWYDHANVSTWNYQAAHIYGKVRILDENEKLKAVTDLTNFYESKVSNPTKVENLNDKFMKAHLSGIVAFHIVPESIQASSKLSQNRDDKNFDNITNQLKKTGDVMDIALANSMKKTRK
jgi:transcriptional regulator